MEPRPSPPACEPMCPSAFCFPDALSAPRALPCGAGTSTGLRSLPGKEDMAGEGSEHRDVFLLLESFL